MASGCGNGEGGGGGREVTSISVLSTINASKFSGAQFPALTRKTPRRITSLSLA